MTAVNGMSEYNQYLANYIYGIDPNAEHGETLGGLAMNIGIMGGATIAAKKLSPIFGKYYDAYKNRLPNQPFSEALRFAQDRADAKKLATDHLNLNANGNRANYFERYYNKLRYNNISEFEAKIQEPKVAEIGTPSERAYFRQKHINELKTADCYKDARRLIAEAKEGKLTGKALKAKYKEIQEAMRQGDIARHKLVTSGEIKPLTTRGKIAAGIKKYSGYNKLKGLALKSKGLTKGLRALKGGLKGSGIMAVASLAFEAPNIIKAFQIDSKSGMTQLGKSLGKTAAGIGGWAAGAAIGQALIPIPGLGALIGGFVGSWAAEKLVSKVVGEKSVAEEHAEAEAKALTQAADNSPETQAQLLTKATAQAQEAGDEEMLAQIEQYAQVIEQSQLQQMQGYETAAQQYVDPKQDIIDKLKNIGMAPTQTFTFPSTQYMTNYQTPVSIFNV